MYTRQLISIALTAILSALLVAVALSVQRGTASAQPPSLPLSVAAAITTTADGEVSDGASFPRLPETGPDAPNQPNSPALSFSYYHVSGTLFQPRKSASTYDYSSNGCVFQTGGTDFRFQAHLLVPEGSIVKYVRIYFLDTAAQDMTVWLTEYNDGTSNTDVTSVSSSGNAAGARTVLSPLITHTVDLANFAYVLSWGTGVLGSANQICGVRVAYYAPPIFGTFLPIIQKNP